ncbi:MAG TPA: hypothetical protein VLA13_02280 [Massilibacterium sp.]|mgnify:CR=1 FL=1|nr:hypothetical protein [Massilibacterium sp.]
MNIFVLSYLIIYVLSFLSMYVVYRWKEKTRTHSPVYYAFINVFFSYVYILIAYALFGTSIAKEIGFVELLFVALILSAPLIFPVAFGSAFLLQFLSKKKQQKLH